jgi:RNA polymerase sigma-70 factor (ECF subfamily)
MFAAYQPAIQRYCETALNDPRDAEDATQEVFARVLAHPADAPSDADRYERWLFTIASHYVIDRLRQKERLNTLSEPDTLCAHLDREQLRRQSVAEADIDTARLKRLLERLTPPQRLVLGLRYVHGLTPTEAAEVLALTADGVRHHEHRALKFLRTRLEGNARL